MKPKFNVLITVTCHNASDIEKAKQAVMRHLKIYQPQFQTNENVLKATVPPLDRKLFNPYEACTIIKATIAQSLSFTRELDCELIDIN